MVMVIVLGFVVRLLVDFFFLLLIVVRIGVFVLCLLGFCFYC